MTDSSRFNRRKFLKASAAATIAAPLVVPASALGLDGVVAPSERITLGGIGIRGRGTKVLSTMLPQPDVRFVELASEFSLLEFPTLESHR